MEFYLTQWDPTKAEKHLDILFGATLLFVEKLN